MSSTLAVDAVSSLTAGMVPAIAMLAGAVGYYLRRRSDADRARALAEHEEARASSENEARLWQTIGRLDQRISDLELEIKRQRLLKHDWRGVASGLHLEKVLLSIEVNAELAAQGKLAKYDVGAIKAPYVNEGDVLERHGYTVTNRVQTEMLRTTQPVRTRDDPVPLDRDPGDPV